MSSFQAAGVVIGERNFSRSSKRSRRSTVKLRQRESGSVCSHKRGKKRARTAFQKALWAKLVSHHQRQRVSVRRSICNSLRSAATRCGVNPWHIAESRTTIMPA